MRDEYLDLFKGTITVNGENIVTGRIEWLEYPGEYKGMKFHTEPLTAEQAHSIDEGPIELGFKDSTGKSVLFTEGHIRADTPVREGAETTVLTPPNHGIWKIDL